ncbi:MAG: hypothetical protein A2X78_01240 [Gammaproteobacteria bacterium GWE2_37_16]|nr:MAG: hypothetical protein A2X78_01240 [Gammaproteobacteria bacterium GWE2_37_16]
MDIYFRPHHFVCAFCFQGAGYSHEFIANFKNIMSELDSQSENKSMINVTMMEDSICAYCPRCLDCRELNSTSVIKLDLFYSELLKLKTGDEISWDEAKKRIIEKVDLVIFQNICSACQWYEICKVHFTKKQ